MSKKRQGGWVKAFAISKPKIPYFKSTIYQLRRRKERGERVSKGLTVKVFSVIIR